MIIFRSQDLRFDPLSPLHIGFKSFWTWVRRMYSSGHCFHYRNALKLRALLMYMTSLFIFIFFYLIFLMLNVSCNVRTSLLYLWIIISQEYNTNKKYNCLISYWFVVITTMILCSGKLYCLAFHIHVGHHLLLGWIIFPSRFNLY